MKRTTKHIILWMLAMLLALALTSYKNYRDDLTNLGRRTDAVEAQIKELNKTLQAIQGLMDALEKGDWITSVADNADGSVTINFKKRQPITLRDGNTGSDGHTPIVTVAKDDDGHYYWKVDGEWMTSGGQRVRADGTIGKDATNLAQPPQVRINPASNMWEYSLDGGSTWKNTGVNATGADGANGRFFTKIEQHETYVTFTFTDGTTLDVPKR